MEKYQNQRVHQQIRAAFSLCLWPCVVVSSCDSLDSSWKVKPQAWQFKWQWSESNCCCVPGNNLILIAAQMGKEFCHSQLCWRHASALPNLCDLYIAGEGPCFIVLPSEFTVGTVFCISKDFRFYQDCIWYRMCLLSEFVWEGCPSSFVHVELRLVGDGIPFKGRRNWSGHLQSSLCFLCPPELQQRLPGQRSTSLDAQIHGRLWVTVVSRDVPQKGQVHPSLGDCQQKVFPPSLLHKRLLFGQDTRVAALCRVSLLIWGSFWDLFGTDAPPVSVSVGVCCGKKSHLRGWMIW